MQVRHDVGLCGSGGHGCDRKITYRSAFNLTIVR